MTRRRFTIGPGAASLILVVIVLCMSTLGVLALMNARSDLALSRRSMAVAEEIYALNDKAERTLARVDAALTSCGDPAADIEAYLTAAKAALPEDITLADGLVTWEETQGIRTLSCAVKLSLNGEGPRLRWVRHELLTDMEEMGFDDPWN